MRIGRGGRSLKKQSLITPHLSPAVGGGIEKAMRLMGVKEREGATSLEDLLADTKLQDDIEDMIVKDVDTNQDHAEIQMESAMENGE